MQRISWGYFGEIGWEKMGWQIVLSRRKKGVKLAVISFTKAGGRLGVDLTESLRREGHECEGYVQARFCEAFENAWGKGIYPVKETVGVWTEKHFYAVDGLIYIGAAGIAVRAVAPFLKDKMRDPAMVVVDELGCYAVSLLSGHVGGANELARTVARVCKGQPVITTATDVNGKTAIDGWAAKQGFWIGDRELAKQVSAKVLEGEPVGFFSDFPLESPETEQYRPGVICEINVWVTVRKSPRQEEALGQAMAAGKKLLRLVPGAMTLGIGCRRGIPGSRIEETVERILEKAQLDRHGLVRIASIDLKKKEDGLLSLSEKWKVPFVTFSAGELERVKESVAESPFVRQVTGTGNVCERAALLAAGDGAGLLVGKQAQNGVTVAVARGQKIWQRY